MSEANIYLLVFILDSFNLASIAGLFQSEPSQPLYWKFVYPSDSSLSNISGVSFLLIHYPLNAFHMSVVILFIPTCSFGLCYAEGGVKAPAGDNNHGRCDVLPEWGCSQWRPPQVLSLHRLQYTEDLTEWCVFPHARQYDHPPDKCFLCWFVASSMS